MDAFVARHAGQITGILECFDRVVFQGHLPINYPEAMTAFLRHQGVCLEGYAAFVARQSDALLKAAIQWAAAEGRPCEYHRVCARKEAWAKEIVARDRVEEGLVGILRITEMSRSFSLRKGQLGARVVAAPRRGLHLYIYLQHRQLGLIHIRLQTWFPFLIQVACNGHDILARQLDRDGIPYERYENSFTWLADPARAAALAAQPLQWNWTAILDRLAGQANPLLRGLLRGFRYRWVIDQCELSTDLLFADAEALGPLYTRLTRHAITGLQAGDIMGYFDRTVHGRFRGEIVTTYRSEGWGTRLKHRVGKNWIKMYNKGGSILRVETVINRPQDFRIRRRVRRRDGATVKELAPLPKSVRYLSRYWDIQTRANRRYLEALAGVEDPARAYARLHELASPVTREQGRARGLNPLARADRKLLGAVVRAEHHLQGFRNEHVRVHLEPEAPADARARKSQSARIRRQLLILRRHGLIRRIPRTRRYRLTRRGAEVIPAALYYEAEGAPDHILQTAA